MKSYVYDSRKNDLTLLLTIREILKNLRLIVEISRIELFHKYKFSALGIFWSFLNPLSISFVLYFVFGRLLNSYMPENRGYAFWVLSGVLFQILVIQGMSLVPLSIKRSMKIILRNRISPAIFSISSAIAQMLNFLLGAFFLIPICILADQNLSWRLALLPMFCFISILALSGFSLITLGLFLRFDDTVYLFNAATMILTYLTPIFYPIEILSGNIKIFVELNPLSSWIEVLRWLFLDSLQINLYNVAVVFVSGLSLFIGGLFVLRIRWKDWQML